jgi:hypothetical protein
VFRWFRLLAFLRRCVVVDEAGNEEEVLRVLVLTAAGRGLESGGELPESTV